MARGRADLFDAEQRAAWTRNASMMALIHNLLTGESLTPSHFNPMGRPTDPDKNRRQRVAEFLGADQEASP